MGGITGKKARKSIDSKDQIKLCFMKKSEKTNKKYIVVPVHWKDFLL